MPNTRLLQLSSVIHLDLAVFAEIIPLKLAGWEDGHIWNIFSAHWAK